MSQPVTRDYRDPDLALKTDAMDSEDADDAVIVVRAEIEQTRDQLSETIDAIQERLNPQVLMQQARETAQEAVQEKVEQARDAVRQATIGKVEDVMSTAAEKVQDVMNAAGEAVSNVTDRVQGAGNNGNMPASSSVQPVQGTGSGTSSMLLDTIRQNPLPAVLAATGLAWLYVNSRSQKTTTPRATVRYGTGTQGTAYPYTYTADRPLGGSPDVYARPGVSGTAALYADQPASAYTDMPQTGNTAPYGGNVQNGGPGTGGIGQALKTVPDTAGQVASKAQETMGQVGTVAQQTAGQLGTQAQQAGGALGQLMQDNPLAVGVAVAGLGMLAGLLVPETEQENELLGQAHDALMDKAEQVAQDTAQKVQDAAQYAAQQGIQNVAKEAINAVKQGVQQD
jgi:ElaB/YqjD/DUF883 family membrane-anchored ribosome-binding protein